MRALAFALWASTLAACSGQTPPPQAPPEPLPAAGAARPDGAKPAGEAKVGDATHCPVSGQRFVVSESSPKVEHEGKTYYFCCPDCHAQFKQDPQKFLHRPAPPPS